MSHAVELFVYGTGGSPSLMVSCVWIY